MRLAGAASVTAAAAAAQTSLRIETHRGPMGTYLTDGSGRSLYMFASDTSSKSTCSGTCAGYWPPLTTTEKASVGGSANAAALSTITRSDGTKQLAYHGHPLYLFRLDTEASDTVGQGSSDFGAKWWLLAPSGKPITSTSSSDSRGNGGWG